MDPIQYAGQNISSNDSSATINISEPLLAKNLRLSLADQGASLGGWSSEDDETLVHASGSRQSSVSLLANPPAWSGAWGKKDDEILLSSRASGLNWDQIQATFFTNKTVNACRMRHERLMERRGADDWDQRKLERLSREYMSMRKEMWQGLAQRCGEKWNVVEHKCMSQGLKTIHRNARNHVRRERLERSALPPLGHDLDSEVNSNDKDDLAARTLTVNVDTFSKSAPTGSQYSPKEATFKVEESAPSKSATEYSPKVSSSKSLRSLKSITDQRKQAIVNCILTHLTSWLDSTLTAMFHQSRGADSPRNDSQQHPDSSSTGLQEAQHSQGRKRARQPSDQNPSDEGCSEDEHDKKRGKGLFTGKTSEDEAILRLACPFLKHNRQKYRTSRSCAWAGFSTVHRVKEHLYRRHMAPKYKCHRCGRHFVSETTLAEHLRSESLCEVKLHVLEEGVSQDQLLALRSKKRPQKDMSEGQKWAYVYRILFPDDNPIPSPYNDFDTEQDVRSHDDDILRRFQEYARSEFPRLLRPELESVLDTIIAERLTSETVVNLTQIVLQRVLHSFERQGSSPDSPHQSNTVQDIGCKEDSFTEQHNLENVIQEIMANPLGFSFDVEDWLYSTDGLE